MGPGDLLCQCAVVTVVGIGDAEAIWQGAKIWIWAWLEVTSYGYSENIPSLMWAHLRSWFSEAGSDCQFCWSMLLPHREPA